MKNIIAFLIIVLLSMLVTGPVLAAPETTAGQLQLPSPVADGNSGNRLTLPHTELPDSLATGDQGSVQSDLSTNFQLEPIASGTEELLESAEEHAQFSIFEMEPALLESTGSWLRRGFWFSEVDAVILNREINKKNQLPLMLQTTGTTVSMIGRLITVDNTLAIAGNKPSVETMPRIKIGRFLFRDQKNRDHTVEFTWFGGGQWSQEGELNAVPTGTAAGTTTLTVPLNVDGGNPSFDGAASSRYDYGSRFNSFELNYQLKGRMQRDQMIMKPDGEWVRAANPTFTRTFLTGLRYFEMNDLLFWNAFDVPDLVTGNGATVDGQYRVHTENDMIGMQIGSALTYETSRWSVGVLGKTGIYLDQMFLQSDFNNTNQLTSGSTDTHKDAVSLLSELRVQGKWHLRPNFSFRAGAELLYVKSVALAPYQVNFVPGDYPVITTSVSPTASSEQYSLFLGFSAGFEGYW
ncbi:MAG: BBP7 family outer membrane beta-barrel protein [Pirellulales bacterium]